MRGYLCIIRPEHCLSGDQSHGRRRHHAGYGGKRRRGPEDGSGGHGRGTPGLYPDHRCRRGTGASGGGFWDHVPGSDYPGAWRQ